MKNVQITDNIVVLYKTYLYIGKGFPL
jgi:hypothetical protein